MKLIIRKIEGQKAFGFTRWEPVNKPAELFCKLMRRKTFTQEDLDWITDLGHDIEKLGGIQWKS